MKTHNSILFPLALALAAACVLPPRLHAEGIPEPGLILYGAVENTAYSNGRLTIGSLSWSVGTANGTPVSLTAPLQDLNGQYSYRLRIPFESLVGGNTAGPNTFILTSGTTPYTHSSIALNAGGTNFAANIVGPALAVFNFNAATRGAVQQMTLRVNAPGVLPSGASRVGLNRAGSGSGTSTAEPWPFQFTGIGPHPQGGIFLEWTGCPTNRPYLLLRAQTVDAGLSDYEVVRVFSASAAVGNSFWDTNTVNTATYFYRLLAQ